MNSWYARPAARLWHCAPDPPDSAGWTGPAGVAAFHARLPGYRPTPLVELPALATELGIGRVFVKDESARLGLGAFKVLGASWAVCRLLAARAGVPPAEAGLDQLRAVAAAAPLTLVTATDGNHGRALAWMARQLGVPARVYLPAAVHPGAAAAIAGEGAAVVMVDGPYDEAVARAAAAAERDPVAVLVQDTGWEGYQRIPRWIVQGYATLCREIDQQLLAAGAAGVPGLVAVPVGVGSLAQAVVAHYRSWPPAHTGAAPAALLGVEPDTAACVLTSLLAGRPTTVPTGSTAMAGLNCGTPSSLAWPHLRAGLDAAVSVTDGDAAAAVTDLGRLGVPAGPSGAAALAGVRRALTGDGSARRRTELGVHGGTIAVVLSTEGPPAAPRPRR